MMRSGFAGKADTKKLIAALEHLDGSQSPDLHVGPVAMDAADHQGRMEQYILKTGAQGEEQLLQQIAPDSLPPIGDCRV